MDDKLEKFFTLRRARAKIELAVLEAMPLVFTTEQSNEMILQRDFGYVQKTWDAIEKAMNEAYLAAKKEDSNG